VADPAGDVTKDRTRVARVVKKHKFDAAKQILTSRDKLATTMKKELAVPDLAKGFNRTLLPTPSTRGSDSIYTGRANSTTGPHSHRTNSLHLILSGWVQVNGKKLSPGDWAYVPAGIEYTLTVGTERCIVFYRHDCPVDDPDCDF